MSDQRLVYIVDWKDGQAFDLDVVAGTAWDEIKESFQRDEKFNPRTAQILPYTKSFDEVCAFLQRNFERDEFRPVALGSPFKEEDFYMYQSAYRMDRKDEIVGGLKAFIGQ